VSFWVACVVECRDYWCFRLCAIQAGARWARVHVQKPSDVLLLVFIDLPGPWREATALRARLEASAAPHRTWPDMVEITSCEALSRRDSRTRRAAVARLLHRLSAAVTSVVKVAVELETNDEASCSEGTSYVS
jgi:hypothetical protein